MKIGEMIMNLTNTQQENKIHTKIQHFFEKELMPLAEEIKQQQEIIPGVHLDAEAKTYYKNRSKTSMRKQDFEKGGHSTLETFTEDLNEFWNNKEDSKLCELVPSLAKLAFELHAVEDQNKEISPYIYVMF
jgi:hypothetical protein